MITLNLVLVAILIVLTGFFVAAEFAMIRLRSSRVNQLVAEGKKGSLAVQRVTTHLDEYLSACQLGITITALGLGWLGEPTIEKIVNPIFADIGISSTVSHILSFVIALAVMTFLHVVLGELAPKTVAIQKAETVTLLLAKPLIWFYRIAYPFIWILNGSARLLVGIFGLKPASEHELAHSEEELRIILSESYKGGEINQSEYKYVNNIFEFDNRIAREIMVPRTEMAVVSKNDTIEEFLKMAVTERYTRYPVVSDSDKDHVMGLVNIKEILNDVVVNEEVKQRTVESYMKPIIQVIESVAIHDLLLTMQKKRIHMAILIDEYGGTAGLVTTEDILEEIVGEIRDEFDAEEVLEIQKLSENHYILQSRVLIEEVNDLLGLDIDNTDMDTIGGWILTQNIDVQKNETLVYESYEFTVKELEGHQIRGIEVKKREMVDSLPEEEQG
ncbi:hemolysin family protein [Priestia megaterium]|uniref:hemolysin family protein n=1 Tax=Priestia megaterium TaxID=1404 RepID=UPI001F30EADE|nr:hemolysin family protein [Priestia megaterium]MCF8890440.1 hemolysin family protein [Priestia megaterium]MED4292672.1 hemolysin family protein [Priestia megaterium]MED4298713.1 hemolysin family protein [Priestia megaterium]